MLTQARLRSNSGDTCLAAALAGQGLILQPTFIVGADLKAGRLVEVLPHYHAPTLAIHAVYPSRQHLSVKVRRMVEFLAAAFKSRHGTRKAARRQPGAASHPQVIAPDAAVGIQGRGIAAPHHLPALQYHMAVGQAHQFVNVFVDHQNRLPFGLERCQATPDFLANHWRQAFGGFIQNEQARVGRQRAADGQHLLLAARELVAQVVGPLLQPGNTA